MNNKITPMEIEQLLKSEYQMTSEEADVLHSLGERQDIMRVVLQRYYDVGFSHGKGDAEFECKQLRQAQHEATWAMAMQEAYLQADRFAEQEFAEVLAAIPCPPLQTTNEKCG